MHYRTLALLGLVINQPCFSQLSRNSQEVWPSVDTYFRLNKNWRLYGTISGTKMEESSYAEGAVGIFADYYTTPPYFIQKRIHIRKDSLPGKFIPFVLGTSIVQLPQAQRTPLRKTW
jgi:hypothetical protein